MVNKLHPFIKKFSTQLYIGWVLFIALITLLPGYSIPGIIDWNFLELDKIIHMLVFAILTYLGCYFYFGKNSDLSKTILYSLLPAILYGLIIELLQTLIPERGFDYADLTADAVGSILGIIVFRFITFKRYILK